MQRRAFLGALSTVPFAVADRTLKPAHRCEGAQLFIDDFLIDHSENLSRVTQTPTKVEGPILTSARYGVTQPYLGVARDPESGRIRLWYNRGPAIWTCDSEDGLHFGDPQVAWDVKRGYGVSIVDDGKRAKEPHRRFKLASWQSDGKNDDTPLDNGGMYVGFSPDGLRWTPEATNPVLRTYPTTYPNFERHGVGDTIDAFWDPVGRRYAAAVKVHALPDDGFTPGPKAGRAIRRLIAITSSADFVHWEKPRRIHVPDSRDEGLLEFYGMGGTHARGPLLIGLVRVLRDDLPCDLGGPTDGIGYTALATSRDGVRWERFREPFLDRRPERGWDHAMAWASAVLPIADELFIYYGGYARGHKIEASKERQIGVARMKRDRYVARRAGRERGLLRTPLLRLPAGAMTVNAVVRDEMRVRLLDAADKPISGFDWVPIGGKGADGVSLPVKWRRPLRERETPVRIEFLVREADLYAFEVVDSGQRP
jgi:hypothetical protein